jgi:hypothetical protein
LVVASVVEGHVGHDYMTWANYLRSIDSPSQMDIGAQVAPVLIWKNR